MLVESDVRRARGGVAACEPALRGFDRQGDSGGAVVSLSKRLVHELLFEATDAHGAESLTPIKGI